MVLVLNRSGVKFSRGGLKYHNLPYTEGFYQESLSFSPYLSLYHVFWGSL